MTPKDLMSNAAKGFNMFVDAYKEYKIISETEHTKRIAIKAWKKV